ncbi:unknown protein [Simkania negevensis Z]|uniref:Uncharacterized protein n=2 Tax=Simkania negevensis TaxID=83561 RepID=F8L6Y4_SIMNZ|nr:unknown protein [Simkania negevensis Z]
MSAINQNFVNPEYKLIVYTACAATAFAGASLLAPWESVRMIGGTTLTGIFYATINDMVACRDCIEYFTFGHVWDGQKLDKRPIMTLDPNLNAIAWGMIASWHVSALAGVLFAAVARLPYAAVKLSTRQIAPYLVGSAIALCTFAHVTVRVLDSWLKELEKNGGLDKVWGDVPSDYKAKFMSVDVRNFVGFVGLGVLGIALSVLMVTTRLGLTPRLF